MGSNSFAKHVSYNETYSDRFAFMYQVAPNLSVGRTSQYDDVFSSYKFGTKWF